MDSHDSQFDVIICGSGLYNCLLGALLSKNGKNVLMLDKNCYYGGDFPTFNLLEMWKKFKPDE